ncbi:MAG: endo-1,4-beta-xylanase [Verrucomicrobia bacterium]|nr:endo-1,4-beta-xylanase [Verrucomicrobiota bacterium]
MSGPPIQIVPQDPLDTTAPPGYGKPVLLTDSGNDVVWQLFDEMKEAFDVPAGAATFCTTLSWGPPSATPPVPEAEENVLWVKFILDQSTVFSTAIRATFPPKEIAFPVQGGHRLTIVVEEGRLGHAWLYMSGPAFSPNTFPTGVRYLPQGTYLAFPNSLRESLWKYSAPGEQVPLTLYTSTSAQTAKVQLTLTPERSGPATQPNTSISFTTNLTIPLQSSDPGLWEGNATWNAPSVNGPASLTISGQLITSSGSTPIPAQTSRVIVAPLANVKNTSPGTFAIHTSYHGYTKMQDEATSLFGAKWARVVIKWPLAELSPGAFDFGRQNELVNDLRAQGLQIVGVLGTTAPSWIRNGNGQFLQAWKQYVQAAVTNFNNKIQYWDVFNEIDTQYYTWLTGSTADGPIPDNNPNEDLDLLSSAIDIIHSSNPTNRAVCCSTGSTWSLFYDQRLAGAGILSSIDEVSMHPYQAYNPEAADGVFSYEGRVQELTSVLASNGISKPVWSTEANWLLGFPLVLATTTEHDQAQYIVRVNLQSLANGVPYFLHSPLDTTQHLDWQLDTFAAYIVMATRFANATNPKSLDNPSQAVYGTTATVASNTVGALWTTSPGTTVQLMGASQPAFFDMYGNPVSLDASQLTLSGSPIYFTAAAGSAPAVNVLTSPRTTWTNLAPVTTWTRRPCSPGTNCTTYTAVNGEIQVKSIPQQYTTLLTSPSVTLQAGTCYRVVAPMQLLSGSIYLASVNSSSRLGITYAAYPRDDQIRSMEMRFIAGSDPVKIIFAGANNTAQVSEFAVYDPVRIAPCPDQN